MAIFDPLEQRMCVRIVYDGAPGAGKTTNLRSLGALFPMQRTTELVSPGELDGRTIYFDWMQIMAGVVCGFPLMCQVISVPGQLVLTPRRQHLLLTADVVVYVCDSSRSAAARSEEGLRMLSSLSQGRALPIIVQANKQDQPDALSGAALLRTLQREGEPFVEAIATEGIGVIDTFVSAVRAVSRAMQSQSENDGLRIDVRRAHSADELLENIRAQKVDPEWAAELLLEEAQTALLVEDRPAPERPIVVDDGKGPLLPTADVPTGFVWPAHTGRTTLRALADHGVLSRSVPCDERGRYEQLVLGHVLRTDRSLRFTDREAARQALVRAARERTQLDQLLVPDTVLVAQPARDDAWWIWTIMPAIPSVAEELLGAGSRDRALLAAYGGAVVDLLRVCMQSGFSVDLGPTSFGYRGGDIRYVGDVGGAAPTAESLSSSIHAAVDAIDRAGGDVGLFLEAFERALTRRMTHDELSRATSAMLAVPAPAGTSALLSAVLTRASAV